MGLVRVCFGAFWLSSLISKLILHPLADLLDGGFH